MGVSATEYNERYGHRPGRSRGAGSHSAADLRNNVSIKFDDQSLMDALDQLGESAGKHVRAAAQAGAKVLYYEARMRVPVSAAPHYFYGSNSRRTGVRYLFEPGNLRAALYHTYSVDNSTPGRNATYHIAWNHQKAPYGFMVEFGTVNAPAYPFLRPAYDAANKAALEVAYDTFAGLMQKEIARMQG